MRYYNRILPRPTGNLRRRKGLLIVLGVLICIKMSGQDYYYHFAGSGASSTIASVKVRNLSSGSKLTIFGNEVLHLTNVRPHAIGDQNSIRIYPNPVVKDNAVLEIRPPVSGNAVIRIFTLTGKLTTQLSLYLGNYSQTFRLSGLSKGFNIIKVIGEGYHLSAKIMWEVNTTGPGRLTKISDENPEDEIFTDEVNSKLQDTVSMYYSQGDRLLFKGIMGDYSTYIVDIPVEDKTVTFPFYQCTDGDKNNYTIVEIGSQIWMAENLMTTKYNDGTDILYPGPDGISWDNLTSGAYAWYNNNEVINKNIYGALYNWHAVHSGILCPSGWHVPSDREWMELADLLGGNDEAGRKIKESGTEYWPGPNNNSTNETGFSALPGGIRDPAGFSRIKTSGFWWSSTFYSNSQKPSLWSLENNSDILRETTAGSKNEGLSVRCLIGQSNASIPFVLTNDVENISTNGVTASGMILSDEGGDIISAGICWNTTENPTVEDQKTSGFPENDLFVLNITDLKPGTLYHVRAYATNSAGTAYGNNISFTTIVALPVVATLPVTDPGQTNATAGGTVTNNGGGTITAQGICWSTSLNPTINDNKALAENNSGDFICNLSGLKPGTSYHVRAWATNSAGTSYGGDVTFTTQTGLAVITTANVTSISQTTASTGGNITDDGGGNITIRGVCWALTSAPTTSNSRTTNGTGTGSFISSVTGLRPGTTYYIRAYASNSAGTAYGEEFTFRTLIAPPTVITSPVSDITWNAATAGGSVSDDGGGIITAKGICWSDSPDPTINDFHIENGSGSSQFTSPVSNLQPGTAYYVRAWATNSAGTSYGNAVSFTTLVTLPEINSTNITGITQTSAVSGGNITYTGGGTITARGICWSLTASPTINDSRISNGTGPGSFTSTITGLQPGMTYHLRAFATNSAGTSYGNELTFTTLVALPGLTTDPVSNIRQTSATSGGNVTFDGGGTVTARGVCWSVEPLPDINDPRTTNGTGTGSFSASITGLSPATAYHIRAYATNSAGTAYGAELTFTTLDELPVLTTTAVTGITSVSAVSGGNITDDGGRAITERGICWSGSANPTTAGSKTSNGTGTGSYSGTMTGLQPGTTYHVRAFATNSAGTSYGNDYSFTTNVELPVLSTSTITGITSSSATSGGNITSNGGGSISARGVCWSVNASPTTNDSRTVNGTGSGSFTSSISSLQAGTQYHVRAYATNSAGTAYGEDLTFTSLVTIPNVTTASTSGISQTTAISGGYVVHDGGASVTERGVCWATSSNPTTGESRTSDGSGTGSFASSISGLQPGTTYHARAYAINSAGTSYGNDVVFTTSAYLPTITTSTVSNITETSASSGGTITSDGGGSVTARGVCWSVTPSPTIAGSRTSNGTGTGSFSSAITGLRSGVTYHVRSYATNSAGTAYGEDITFTTLVAVPIVTTANVTGIKQTNAASGGNITDDGGAPVTERGVCWSTVSNPTTSDQRTSDGSGTGIFTSSIAGLQPATLYHVRAYAVNSAGTAYGNDISFTTQNEMPVVSTSAITAITQTTATTGGNVTDDGGRTVTERGVCWANTPNPTISGNKTVDGSGTGSFVSSISGLVPGTAYYIRAYATNSAGTAYGNQLSFFTDPAGPPEVNFTWPVNEVLHTAGNKRIILSAVGSDFYIRFSSDNGSTFNQGVKVTGIFTPSNKARILGNGNIVLFCVNRIYYSDDNMTTIRSCNVVDKDENTYVLHTPVNSSYPGGYFNIMGGFAEKSGVCLMGNYGNSSSGASPINLYSSLDGKTWKVIYTFGQNLNRTDNGTPSGGTGGILLGDPGNPLITRHIHAINIGDDGAFYVCTGDITNEMHFLKCVYNQENDSWTINDVLTGDSRSRQRLRALGVFERNGYYYWGSDGSGTFQYGGVTYNSEGIYKCPVNGINDPSQHIQLQPLTDACYSFVNSGHIVFAGLQSQGYVYISYDYGETWIAYEKPSWMQGEVSGVWHDAQNKIIVTDDGVIMSSDSF